MTLKNFFAAGATGDCIALLAGAMLTLAFAPFHLFPLAILAMWLLLSVWRQVTAKRALRRGFLFGLGLFSTGVYWVYISIHTFGDAPIWLASIITAGFVAILALFPAVTGYFLCRYFPQESVQKSVLAFPAYWLLVEWSRSWIFTGFPWLSLGYSQSNSWLRGYAPVFSVYGVSLAVTLTAGVLAQCVIQWRARQRRTLGKYVIFLSCLWGIGGLLLLVTWTHPFGKPLQVSLIQGNIPQAVKWSPESLQPTLDRYIGFTRDHWGSDIIVWPEGAIPLSLPAAAEILVPLDKEAIDHHATIITGIPIRADLLGNFYNAIVSIGVNKNKYLKQRLVPFGEYTPLHGWLKKPLSYFNIPMSDFVPGAIQPKQTLQLTVAGIQISPFICYEIAFPEQVKRRADSGMLLTISDDAWFGHSIAQAQHLEIARMRSLELGKPQLFVGNDGLTAIIDQRGAIQAQAPPFVPYVLTDHVQPYSGATLWQLFGLDPILLIVVAMLIKAKIIQRRKT